MSTARYTLTIEDEELYVKELLQRKFLFSSRLIRKLKVNEGTLRLDGVPCRLRDKGKAGQELTCDYPEEQSYFEPEDIPLDIVYEDGDLLVINKQPFITVHPTKNYQNHTLANAISYYIKQKGEVYKLRFVNRLDRDTSGLIIVAKNPHAQDFLNHEMEKNAVIKKYYAIVHGLFDEKKGTVDQPIGKNPDHVARRMVREDGQSSVTHYEVLDEGSNCSLLSLKLDTGRTHQIRVHMDWLGHTLVGDDLYGSPAFPGIFPRQALHSYYLEFTHPASGRTIKAETAMPKDMEDLWNTLKNSRI